jgi:hypothetical protein
MPNMYTRKGAGKVIAQDWDFVQEYDDNYRLKKLTPQQAIILQSMCTYLSWATRWFNPPEQAVLEQMRAEIEDRLMTDIDFCAEMITCITSDLDVIAAIQALTNPAVPGSGQNTSGTFDQDITGYNPACDKDRAWGNLLNLVERAANNVMELFNQIELTTDNQEMINRLVDLLPGVGLVAGEIVIFDLSAWLDNVRDWMNDAFIAANTDDQREQAACDLLCLWNQTCSLSMDKIMSYFIEKTTSLVPSWSNVFGSAVSIISAMEDSTTSFGDAIFYAMLGAQFGLGYYLNDFFGLSFTKIAMNAALGEPSDDWTVLCDPCQCITVYSRPAELPPGFTVDVGTLGVSNVILSSAPYDPPGSEVTAWLIAHFEITLNACTQVQYILNQPGTYGWEMYFDDAFRSGENEAQQVGIGRYALTASLPAIGNNFTILNIRREIGVLDDFALVEIRITEACD